MTRGVTLRHSYLYIDEVRLAFEVSWLAIENNYDSSRALVYTPLMFEDQRSNLLG